jgi:hypothetical protein
VGNTPTQIGVDVPAHHVPAHQVDATLANQDLRGLSNTAHARHSHSKDADPHIPILKAAKAEYANLHVILAL